MMNYNKILVPTDGSKFSAISEKRALKMADQIGAELIFLSVAENNFSFGFRYKKAAENLSSILIEEANENIKSAENLAKDFPNVNVSSVVKEGIPADVILNYIESEDIDLVVIGSSGKSGITKFVMGSVAEKVVTHADCDVLVIH